MTYIRDIILLHFSGLLIVSVAQDSFISIQFSVWLPNREKEKKFCFYFSSLFSYNIYFISSTQVFKYEFIIIIGGWFKSKECKQQNECEKNDEENLQKQLVEKWVFCLIRKKLSCSVHTLFHVYNDTLFVVAVSKWKKKYNMTTKKIKMGIKKWKITCSIVYSM